MDGVLELGTLAAVLFLGGFAVHGLAVVDGHTPRQIRLL